MASVTDGICSTTLTPGAGSETESEATFHAAQYITAPHPIWCAGGGCVRWLRPDRPVFVTLSLRQMVLLTLMVLAAVILLAWAIAARPGALPAEPLPLAGWKIAVDPGHGGEDSGACHGPSGMEEKTLNLDIAGRLEKALAALGAEVWLSRREDVDVPPQEAVRAANAARVGLYFSLHVNSFPTPDCFGAQTFYSQASPEGRRLALLLQEELVRIQPENFREALAGDYYVLQHTQMPAALIEVGFITHPGDRALLSDPEYREKVSAAIARAAVRFVRGETAGPGGAPPALDGATGEIARRPP